MPTIYKHLLVQKSGVTTTVTFNRPQKMNPLGPQLMLEFKDVLAGLRADNRMPVCHLHRGRKSILQRVRALGRCFQGQIKHARP